MQFSSVDHELRRGRSEMERPVVESTMEEHEIKTGVQERARWGVVFVSRVKKQANLTGSFIYSTKVY